MTSRQTLHIAPMEMSPLSLCGTSTWKVLSRGSEGIPETEWYVGELRVLVGLDAEDDVLVGAAPRLLPQEQT